MSTPRIPAQADFRKLAISGGRICGSVALDELPRIKAELFGAGGEARVDLHFAVDEEGYRVIEGRVEAALELQCQRCLGAMTLPVDAEVRLAMVWGEEEIPSLPQRFEGVVVGEGAADLYGLVEEELLLAIPFAPRHPEGECAVRAVYGGGDDEPKGKGRPNPFAVLAGIKGGVP